MGKAQPRRDKGGNAIFRAGTKQDASSAVNDIPENEEKKKPQINALQTQATEQLDVGEARKRLKASDILAKRSGGSGLKSLLGA